MNKTSENRKCQNCGGKFIIEPDDFGFYEKMKVPPPTFCPECRMQRRNAWRNSLSLYSRKCELCQKSVISIYSPDSGIIIYCNKCWWSDAWNPKEYAMDYDFSRPFFPQFRELIAKVPHIAIVNDDGIASLNCEYTHDWWFSKNCYMCFSGWYVENVLYSFFILAGKDIMDCSNLRSKNEFLYECIRCATSYRLKYSQSTKDCIESSFLANCFNCSNCFMCYGLRDKKYYFKNKQYAKEEYEKILAGYKLDTFSGVQKARTEFDDFMSTKPQRYAQNFHNLNVVGEEISYSKNLKKCFAAKKSENCSYCDFISGDKDSYDITMSGEISECYDTVVADHSQLNLFGLFSVKSQDVRYTQHCHSSKHLFGCVGLRNASYCIFNKQYTKKEYEILVQKITRQMDSMPYVDKIGNEYRYGEFYPIELSPFGYNETISAERLPLITKEEAERFGFSWQDNVQRTTGKETLKPENIPESIEDVTDSILQEILECIDCKRNYKITPNELIFYRKMQVPVARRCFHCRHKARLLRQYPFKLWRRSCMCGSAGSPATTTKHFHGEGECTVEFETSYAPDRPEIVYCEKCYQTEMY